MIVYKIDRQAQAKASSEIREMMAVLSEIAPTLQTLRETLVDHEASISSPTISNFRSELQQLVQETELASRKIQDYSQRLITVSDQAAKHLAAIEEHFGAALQNRVPEETATYQPR